MEAARTPRPQLDERIRAAQVRLLYSNSGTGLVVTGLAALTLGYLQLPVVPPSIVFGWLLYMLAVSAGRFLLARRYGSGAAGESRNGPWGRAYAAGAGLSALGWGAAGILLFPESSLINQVFLTFVLGGMMLGGAYLLAPRPEAFLAFLLPTGLLPALRLLYEGDEDHLAMGLLAGVFTGAVVTTTWRIYRTMESSLHLQFENEALVEQLKSANEHTEALNQELERRVQERTAELHASSELLRSEIAQRKQMEDELLRVRNLESLGVLAGGIAHDFNNFLTVIQGNIGLARLQIPAGDPVQETFQEMLRACNSAAFLSSQLLTFAKGGAPVRRVVSVAKLLTDVVHLARAGASVAIDVDFATDLWNAEVDAAQIEQALHNLLLNARQAMPGGGIVEVRAANLMLGHDDDPNFGPHVRISIRDYGCGIPPEALPRIFDPYFTTKPGGSGLGLTTAYAIVSRHGGRISVSSTVGEGSTFIIDLPAAPAARPEGPAPDAPLSRGTGKLLVMDDEEALRALLERTLATLGYQVVSARDGAEAIAQYERALGSGSRFDAVLLDLTVSGGMGGREAAAKLKELDPGAKLIVSSGYSDAAVMSSFRQYGFDAMLPKPWEAAQLGEVFRRVLSGGAAHKT
jgi:signal transduction histidine kinase/CheY-like chemotaxis protein